MIEAIKFQLQLIKFKIRWRRLMKRIMREPEEGPVDPELEKDVEQLASEVFETHEKIKMFVSSLSN